MEVDALRYLFNLYQHNPVSLRKPPRQLLQEFKSHFDQRLKAANPKADAIAQLLNSISSPDLAKMEEGIANQRYDQKYREEDILDEAVRDLNLIKGSRSADMTVSTGETLGVTLLVMQDILCDGIEDLNAMECRKLNFDLEAYKQAQPGDRSLMIQEFLVANQHRFGEFGYQLAAISFLKMQHPRNPKAGLDDLCNSVQGGQTLKNALLSRLERTDDQKIEALQTLDIIRHSGIKVVLSDFRSTQFSTRDDFAGIKNAANSKEGSAQKLAAIKKEFLKLDDKLKEAVQNKLSDEHKDKISYDVVGLAAAAVAAKRHDSIKTGDNVLDALKKAGLDYKKIDQRGQNLLYDLQRGYLRRQTGYTDRSLCQTVRAAAGGGQAAFRAAAKGAWHVILRAQAKPGLP